MGFVFAHAGGGLIDHDSVMILMPVLPMLLFATIVAAAWLERRGHLGVPGRMVSAYSPIVVIAAALSLAAAGIHFAVISEHLEYDVAEAIFFFALGTFQVIWAQFYLARDSRQAARVGAAVSVMVILIWLTSRTIGLPYGPTPWVPYGVGMADLLATSFEIGLIALLLPRLLPERFAGWLSGELPVQKAFVLAGFTVVAVTLLTSVALLPDAFELINFGE